MNTEKIEDPAADIAWMRRIAEEGQQTPMQGASILFGAGLIYGIGSLGHWAVASGLVGLDMEAVNYIWLAATLTFFAMLILVLRHLGRTRTVVTSAGRASGTAWASVGWGIFALALSMFVLSWRMGGEAAMVTLALMPSMIMVFYGSGWAVTAAMQRSKPLWALAIASFAAAPLLAVLVGQAEQYLAYAAALFLLMGLPGFLMMRAARG
ncbi:hypothetical protein N0B44_32145 [Roseibacterium beibuensis]|uniref:hypothetical protein n=1 Tax=[Roseibacterium] beibuensis TaxID=1193142 RepID=UPI00217DC1A6|nr:hypothetical protein [Roseibacterium beibuensis]MCS6627565.1 hypothetical protein [Roseibacterium beibuensis]